MYKRALVSVFDKTGLEEFLKPLVEQGLEIVSTGGTGRFLKSKEIPFTDVEGITGFPEALSGRVKTLHPHIHMSLLAREWIQADTQTLNIYHLKPFDLVIGNLYPFEKEATELDAKELVEWIDVGGPSFLRAAAKNYFSITTVCHPRYYKEIQKGTDLEKRKKMASHVFEMLSQYDLIIAKTLQAQADMTNSKCSIQGQFLKTLRYGENPHQKAHWYKTKIQGLHEAETLQGKVLSYNNLLDFSEAVLVVRDFPEACAVAVKHNNPCGIAIDGKISLAVERALKADPLSVFGALLALNRPMDLDSAKNLKDLFLEGIIAPDFSSQALEILKQKKNLRVLKWKDMLSASFHSDSIREIIGGFLVQTRDQVEQTWPKDWEIIGKTPSEEIKKDLLFAWKLCAHLKSNAIAIVSKGQSLGLGVGELSRVDAVQLALNRAKKFHPLQKQKLVLASDAFFPFPDSIDLASQGGISWIIQPGGSVRDKEVIKRSEELGINMILTKKRHFKH